MDKQLLLHEFINSELLRYKQLLSQLELQQSSLLPGSIVKHNGDLYHFARTDGRQHMTLLRDNEMIDELKHGRFAKKAIPILQSKIRACEKHLSSDKLYNPFQIESDLPSQYHGLSSLNLFLPEDISPEKWANESYKRNPSLIRTPYYTAGGQLVRSKSESMIGTLLEDRNLIFRIEPELILGSETFYPDFLILLPYRRRLVYYEHFGMMDDPEYALKTMHKICTYSNFGIHSGINFFISYESKNMPFDFKDALNTINEIMKLDQGFQLL